MEGRWRDSWADVCVGGEETGERLAEWVDGPGQRYLTAHPHSSLSALILAVVIHPSECLFPQQNCVLRAGLSLLPHNLTSSSESPTWSVLCAQGRAVKDRTAADG